MSDDNSSSKATRGPGTSYFPLSGLARDGFSNEEEASATCFCGKVQMALPLKAPGLITVFVCSCYDCRKITASMFASNITVKYSATRFIRGEELLSEFSQKETIEAGNVMTNHFCSNCGTLMLRKSSGYDDMAFLRLGTVDDFNLHETILKPRVEQYCKDRVDWFEGVKGGNEVKRFEAMQFKSKTIGNL